MAVMFKVVCLLVVLSIVSDITQLGSSWLISHHYGGDVGNMQSYSLVFPGVNARPSKGKVIKKSWKKS